MPKYFESFPIIDYQVTNTKTKKCVDIIRRFTIPESVYDSDTYAQVLQREGDTPEGIAYRDYQNTNKYWSFLLFNKVINPFTEWSLPSRSLEKKLDDRYPGISLFVTSETITDLDTSTLNTKTSNASYRINDTVKIYDDTDVLVDEGILYEYDRTTGHMKVSGVDTFTLSAGYYITDTKGGKKMYIARKFDYAKLGLFEFKDQNGNLVSPYKSFGGLSVINHYIRGNDSDLLSTYDVTVVTARDKQIKLNENLGKLYYPTEELLDQIEIGVKAFNKNST